MTPPAPIVYRIRVRGDLDPSWSDRLAGMRIVKNETGAPPTTTLIGELPDHSALHGVLNTLLELDLPILSARCLSDGERAEPGAEDE